MPAGVGRRRADRARAGRRPGGAGQAHRRAVGLRVAPGERRCAPARPSSASAGSCPASAASAATPWRSPRPRPARTRGPSPRPRRPTATASGSTARSGSSPSATSPTTCSCWRACRPTARPTMFLVDKDLPACAWAGRPRYTHTFVYEHPEFAFDGVRVGPEPLLGEVGGGYELTRDWFTEERLMIGARTIGAADARAVARRGVGAPPEQGGARLIDRQMIQAHARRLGRRDRHEPRAHPPGRVGVRPRRRAQDAPRQARRW